MIPCLDTEISEYTEDIMRKASDMCQSFTERNKGRVVKRIIKL